ncbi:MAG: PAS domain S-box protein [Spirochaetaceae bacterium]|nr:PAS domain S-box protein [Spirochaetaceae bacterium]
MSIDRESSSDRLKNIKYEELNSTFLEYTLSSLINTFPDRIYLKDTQSRFILINESLVSLFKQKNQDEILGKNDFDFFSQEHAQAAYDDEQEIMRTGEGKTNFIEKETWEDGTVTWVASTKVPFYDKDDNIIGLFGISRDITQRKKIELELENRAKELNCFIEISTLAKKKDLSAEGFIKKITDLIPHHLSYAGIKSVRIIIGHKAIKCSKFKETDFIKFYKIKENNTNIGSLEIFFERNIKRNPYKLATETNQVLKLIADKVGEVLERKWIEKDIRKWEHIINDAERHKDLFP